MTAGRPILYYAIEDKHLTYECEEIVTLGRGPNMKISLPQEIPGISRHHATIRQEGSRWIIEDADSRNGTYVDRTRVKTQTLLDGCIIHLGTFPLKFHAPQRQAATVELTNPVSSRPSISFSDTFDVQPDASININDFSMSSPGRGFSGHDNAGTIEFDQAESSELRARWFGPQQAWSIDLFSELGKGLQVATNLDEMLENVLTLLFHQIKIADSAVILKVDPSGKNFQSLVQRSATGEEILVSRTVMNKAVAMRSSLLVHDAASDPQYETVESLRGSDVTSVICAPLSHENLIIGAIYIDARQRKILFGQRELEICTALSRFTAVAMDLFEQRNRVREQAKHRERLARYIGPSVVDRIVAAGDDNNMLADKEVVTVLFSDLRGFTKIAEHLPPQEVVDLLNGIFGRLTDAVFRHNGTLDKFIGDGMMAFFGAPLKLPDHARQAVLAAQEMLTAIDDFNRDRRPDEQIGIRIGINTGDVIVGDIGSKLRKDYTVIGDTVNVASRLESSVAQPGQIAIGPKTKIAIGEEFVCEELPPVVLKGRAEPITPYRVFGKPATGGS